MTFSLIIICHDLLPPSRRGSHVKSDFSCTIFQHSPLSPYTTKNLCFDISSCTLLQSTPNESCNGIPPSPGHTPPEHGRIVWKNTDYSKNDPVKLKSSTYAPGLSTLSNLLCIVAQPPLLIDSLYVCKPPVYFKIHSTCQLPFYSSSSMHLFIPNSIHCKLWHSNQTSQILHLKNIHFPSLSQHISYLMPLLCKMI